VFKGWESVLTETIIASRLAATAAEDRDWVGVPNAKSIGWAIYAAGFVIWLFERRPRASISLGRGCAVVDFYFRSQPRIRTRTCAHVREHGPDLLVRATGNERNAGCYDFLSP
jgi:hypothetical protein